MNKIKDKEEKLKAATIMLEDYFMKINWNAKIVLDPYTNYPYITSIISRKIANQFLGKKKYQHPDGVWQCFKQKYFPYWLKEKFPIKIKTIEFSFRAVFPDYQPPSEKLGNWFQDVSIQKYYE